MSAALVAGASAEGVLYAYAIDPDAVTNLAGFGAMFGAPMAIAIAFGAVLLAIGWQLWRQVSPAPDSPVPTI